MEFLDEYESRPRFLLQSKQQLPLPSDSDGDSSISSPYSIWSWHMPTLFVSLSLSILILVVAFLQFNNSEPLKSLLLWVSFSLLVGPFAPSCFTAGDIRVGLGPPLEETPKTSDQSNEKIFRKSPKLPTQKKPLDDSMRSEGVVEKSTRTVVDGPNRFNGSVNEVIFEEREWTEADEELLKKLMGKHPVGKPGRWEAIAEDFKGKHKVESVIMKAKEMGDKKVSDQDSYKKFLKDRKFVGVNECGDEGSINGNVVEDGGKESSVWSPGDDLALLNALKTFPKDIAMRWEKIAAAVPGKTKSACMKRVAELKKDFRSSKASSSQATK